MNRRTPQRLGALLLALALLGSAPVALSGCGETSGTGSPPPTDTGGTPSDQQAKYKEFMSKKGAKPVK